MVGCSKTENRYLVMGRWEVEMQSGGEPKEVRKMVGGLGGERTERMKHREGVKHTKQQTEGTE